jgi:alanyl-tRNA synthetase
LSLKVFGSPIFWGYRNEFFFEYNGKRLDMGTIECLPFTPSYEIKNNQINYKEVVKKEKGFIGSGIGLERMVMVLENAKNIWDISLVKPLINLLRKNSRNKNVENRTLFLISEVLKVFQYIISERGGLTSGELGNKHRREIISKFLNALTAGLVCADLQINEELIEGFLSLNKSLNEMDSKELPDSKKISGCIFKILKEQLRLYQTSQKYQEKLSPLIINLKN